MRCWPRSEDDEEIIARVAALDIGKAEVVCCVRVPGPGGRGGGCRRSSTHSTMTRSLLVLANRLVELAGERVVMEATGGLLEAGVLPAGGPRAANRGWSTPATSSICRAGPRPTCWTRCGCARSPSGRCCGPVSCRRAPIRRLRDLTRYRVDLVAVRTAEKNRVEKLLEDACIKLSVVASDIFGVSGRAMMAALIAGERDPKVLAQMARARMRAKIPQLEEAFIGHFDDHHAFLLAPMLARIDAIDRRHRRRSTRGSRR